MEEKLVEKTQNQTQEKTGGQGSSIWGIILFLILVLVDQLTKLVADAYLDKGEGFSIIEGWLGITFTYNRGISYGMGSDASPYLKLGVIALTAVMMAVIAVVFFKLDKRRTWLKVACVLIVAGGVGNLIDRVYYRVWDASTYPYGVRDMVDLSRFGFAVCNFADFFISIGAVMLVLAFICFDKDAFFPVGKYKILAKEAAEEEEKKAEERKAKKQEKKDKKNG